MYGPEKVRACIGDQLVAMESIKIEVRHLTF